MRAAKRLTDADARMGSLLLTLLQVVVVAAKLCGPGGVRAVIQMFGFALKIFNRTPVVAADSTIEPVRPASGCPLDSHPARCGPP